MKNQFLKLSCIALVAGVITFTSCSKEDTTAPVITLAGSASMTISLNSNYTEPGATAKDDEDGDITPVITGTVNKDLAGTYTITYTATDAAGNSKSETRTVIVKNDADANWVGTYTASEVDANGTYNYTSGSGASGVTIESSTTVNNRVTINNMGDYANNNVYATVAGTSITIPSQTVANVGTGTATCDVHSRQTDGNGSMSSMTITITYNDMKVSPCSGTRTGVVATFVKQ